MSDVDLHLFHEGTHRRLHDFLGAHTDGTSTTFRVWAPNARHVSLVLTTEDGEQVESGQRGESGIWTMVVGRDTTGCPYRYRIVDIDGHTVDKADPVGTATLEPPSTWSVHADLNHEWADDDWMAQRGRTVDLRAPVSIYEMHLGSWGRHLTEGRRFPTYAELADPIADHVIAHGFTHVELLPITEHPFYGSWGYQTTGYFAPTARYGDPVELMQMVDRLHQRGVGVILDWVPSHFPTDEHGLYRFDGTHLFEHADPRQGYHPDWNSAIFNYGRNEVRSFLVSSAMAWIERFHIDGLRVDAVASMLYLDYSRSDGGWVANQYGGNENLEAIAFLRQLNEAVYAEHPDVATFAEESTAWPLVSAPTYLGGLGFGYKWDMGWMHDALAYLQQDPMYRKWHHHQVTFRSVYATSEHYVLPLGHDEVVHGKGSLLAKMPGDRWQQFANLRLLLAMQWAQPGKKLLFMGDELGAPTEWGHDATLDWSLHDADDHQGIRLLVTDLNRLYRTNPAMHDGDDVASGMRWVEAQDAERSVFAWLRESPDGLGPPILVVVNATPTVQYQYRLGVPVAGTWSEMLNTDAPTYGGTGVGNLGAVETTPVDSHGFHQSVLVTIPPLGALYLSPDV
jgi:1,4-alpha-glucan branching enzyme